MDCMNKTTLINILLSLADEEIRMFARWLVAHLPPTLYDVLQNPIAVRLLGPLTAWVEARGTHKSELVKALYEKLSDAIDAAAHELFTRRTDGARTAAQWTSEFETAAPRALAPALTAHGGGMCASDFLHNVWQTFNAAVTSLDEWLTPRLKTYADTLEQHPAMRKRRA